MVLASTKAASRSLLAGRTERRLGYRRRMIGLIAGSYVVDALVLAAYFTAGTTASTVPLAYAMLGLGACGLFFVASEVGLTERTRDHYLTVPQIAAASAIQFAFLYFAPEVGIVFLTTLFIIFGFGSLRLSSRQAAAGWGLAAGGLAMILLMTDKVPLIPATTYFERVITLFVFVLALGRCVFLGLYGSSLRETLHERNVELRAALGKIEQLASLDALTGALNRRSLMLALEEEIARAESTEAPLSIAILDLDWFKSVNDRYGHLAGDDVLKRFAELTAATMRTSDRFGRYGGEEFVLILPQARADAALAVVERIREAVARSIWGGTSPELLITVSAGVAEHRRGDSAAILLGRADAALYRAKHDGRNRAIAA
jgi:diguanylate cyclase (GGDEF)-like protein